MPQLFGFARIGRDTEVRETPNGDPVANVSLAFNYGKKGDDNKRPTQWVDGVIWGNRADALAEYLVKGQGVAVTLDDVHIETFTKSDGVEGHKLVGKITQIELAGSAPQQQGSGQQRAPARQQTQQRPAATQQRAPARQTAPAGGFDDMDDDIPF